MKKLFMAALVFLVAFGAFGAGQDEAGKGSGVVEVEFSTWQWVEPQNQPYWQALMEDFNSLYPDIELTISGVASGEFNQKLLTRISAGDAPDAFVIRPTQVAKLVDIGALHELDRWIDQAPWKDNLLPATKPGIIDGTYYAILAGSTPQALCYNKKIFSDAGVKVPVTLDDLTSTAQTIYNMGTGVFGYGCVSDVTNVFHMNVESRKWVAGFGSDWADNGNPTADAPGTIEGTKFYKQLYDAEYTPMGKDLPSLDQMVWEEKLAMMIEGAWLFGAVKVKNPSIYEDMSAAFPPTPTHACIVGGGFFGMYSDSEKPDAAWKVLDFINTKKWQQNKIIMTAQLPAQANMVPQEVLGENPWWSVFNEGAEKYAAAYGYMAPGFELVADEYNNEIGMALADILGGDTNVEQRLAELQKTLVQKFVK